MKDIEKYIISCKSTVKEAIQLIDSIGYGFVLVGSGDNMLKIIGIVTDGDFRRGILNDVTPADNVMEITNKEFKYLDHEIPEKDWSATLNEYNTDVLPVIVEEELIGIVYNKNNSIKVVDRTALRNIPLIIMAGGLGKRMEPFTKILPKPLLPIKDNTLIDIIIANYAKYGLCKLYVSVNYKASLIKAYLGDINLPIEISYLDESKPLGTAGALGLLKGKRIDDFFVTNCDIIVNDNYSEIYKFHKSKEFSLTVVTSIQHYQIPYGVCEIQNGGIIKGINEKPEVDMFINTGMYVMNSRALEFIPDNQTFNLTDLIHILIENGHSVGAYPVSEKSWIDLGQWGEYNTAIGNINQILRLGN